MGVMEMIAPLEESNELCSAIKHKDFEAAIRALQSGIQTAGLGQRKCGALHLASQENFIRLVEVKQKWIPGFCYNMNIS